jgi:hypothetical protein
LRSQGDELCNVIRTEVVKFNGRAVWLIVATVSSETKVAGCVANASSEATVVRREFFGKAVPERRPQQVESPSFLKVRFDLMILAERLDDLGREPKAEWLGVQGVDESNSCTPWVGWSTEQWSLPLAGMSLPGVTRVGPKK